MVTTEKPDYKVVGTRPIRHDGVDKVIGRAEYGADIRLPGMLPGAVLRSPHAHARILGIDTSRAEAHPGVRAVVTSADFPSLDDVGEVGRPDNVLAHDKVLYVGHAVAAVAAVDLHTAEDALELIDVQYEVLPHVMDVRDAMLDGAPILDDQLRTANPDGSKGDTPTNVAQHIHYEKGDAEAGFAAADLVIEREYGTTMAHQGYIEPHNSTAYWSKDDEVTIWSSTQGLFAVRDAVAGMLGLPVKSVKVEPVEIGGGFGGKIPDYLSAPAALLSRKTGKPVQLTMSRKEVLEATGPTSGTHLRVKIGAKRDGTFTAMQAWMAYEAGGFPGSPMGAGAMCVFAPYDCENQLIDGYDVILNKPKTAAYRAPGAPASEYAAECVIDELAEALDRDPLELRMQNSATEGTQRADGFTYGLIGHEECLQTAQDSPHYQSEISGANRGRGVASGFWFNIGFETSMAAQVQADGTVPLVMGAVDIGGSRASAAMQLAEALGIAAEDVKPHIVDTDSVGFTFLTGGSRTAFANGWAAYECAMDIRGQLEERAATIWDCAGEDVSYGDDGVIRGPNDEDGAAQQFSFQELAAELPNTGGGIVGRADVSKTSHGPAFATHIVDVEVDPETGKVEILRYTAIQDAGTAIHPSYVEGQMQGGASQGIGMALNEEYIWDEKGRMVNSSLLDYRMPTALDLPMIDTIIVEVPNPGHPYGVRGVGEVPIVPPAPALHAAIYDAIGERMRMLPMSPTRILERTLPDDD
ncbi:MAG: xanthine dehydrogenase family protein molybdopterin-binding subunit [Chloroflexi bacterium]|nr:xanthine dehydrogenase family protein molybdopterin-binding subunit [Chloroflexota bacterium]